MLRMSSQLSGEEDMASKVMDILSTSLQPNIDTSEFTPSILASMASWRWRAAAVERRSAGTEWMEEVKLITEAASSCWKQIGITLVTLVKIMQYA